MDALNEAIMDIDISDSDVSINAEANNTIHSNYMYVLIKMVGRTKLTM